MGTLANSEDLNEILHFQAQLLIIDYFCSSNVYLEIYGKKWSLESTVVAFNMLKEKRRKRRKKILIHWNRDIQNCKEPAGINPSLWIPVDGYFGKQ